MGLWKAVLDRIAATRHRLGEFWWYSMLMLAIQPMGILINFYVGAVLVPRLVSKDDLGAILPMTQVAAFLAVPLGLLMTPLGKYLNTFLAKGELGKAKSLLLDAGRISVLVAIGMALYTAAVAPFVLLRLHLAGATVIFMLCLMAFVGGIKPVIINAVQSLKRFNNMLISGMIAAPMRFSLVWLLAGAFGLIGYLGSMVALDVLLLLIPVCSLVRLLGPKVPQESYRAHWGEMLAFSWPLVVAGIIGSFSATILPFVIRHWLPVNEQDAYYILTRFGEISGFIGTIIMTMLMPMASERFERGHSAVRLLRQASIVNVAGGGLVVVAFAMIGGRILGLQSQWALYCPFSDLLWRLSLVRLLEMVVAGFAIYEIACRRFVLMWCLTAVDFLMALLLYSLMGWDFFRPYLPTTWWEIVNGMGTHRLGFVANYAVVAQLIRLPVIGAIYIGRAFRLQQFPR